MTTLAPVKAERGRPDRFVTAERRERFEQLICDGWKPIDAARECGMSPAFALRVIGEFFGLGTRAAS